MHLVRGSELEKPKGLGEVYIIILIENIGKQRRRKAEHLDIGSVRGRDGS